MTTVILNWLNGKEILFLRDFNDWVVEIEISIQWMT